MQGSQNICQTPDRSNQRQYLLDNSIGDLFRQHGEAYIKIYKPSIQHIKLIRAIRVCRTPALGGKRIACNNCSFTKHIYLSCGHSHCPLCQNNKRQLWQEKLAEKFLNVPYVHIVFTIPHELNVLARKNEKEIYNITMRAAWKTIKMLSAKSENVGGLPGMVAVLHTFGSDMRYHIHVHTLVTFGGLDSEGKWHWPKRKKKIASYREMSNSYRDNFLSMLTKRIAKNKMVVVPDIDMLVETIRLKRWNVRNEYPTANTEILERYLSRYINRVAISKSRLEYVAAQQKINDEVNISYKDYRNQSKGEPAPLAQKTIHPLVAINQFLSHVLPPYFQKSRYYGIHSPATYKRIGALLPKKLKRNTETIRMLFKLLNHLAGLESKVCDQCQGNEFTTTAVKADVNWIFNFITIPSYRGPPKVLKYED